MGKEKFGFNKRKELEIKNELQKDALHRSIKFGTNRNQV